MPDHCSIYRRRRFGNVLRFHDFSSTIPARQRGQLKSFTDSAGNVTATTYNSTGQLTEVTRSTGSGASLVTESYLYSYRTYAAGESNTGRLADVMLRRQVGAGAWVNVRQAVYDYYDGQAPAVGNPCGGVAGDLRRVEVKDQPSGTIIDSTACRTRSCSVTGPNHWPQP